MGIKIKNRENSRNSLLVLIAIGIILLCLGITLNIYLSRPFEVRNFDVEFMVNNSIGFDVNSSLLKFGRITPGGTSTRTILIDNSYDFPLTGKIFASSNLIGLISAPNDFTISAKNVTSIGVSLTIPMNYTFGNYKGKIRVEMRR